MSHEQLRQGAEQAFMQTGRPAVMGRTGAVASPHYLASQAGLWMLEKGGHAVDATIAMNAVLCVVYPHMAGMGGDVFAQVWDPTRGEVDALNGSGRSGFEVTRDKYSGKSEIPMRGVLGAITVPGCVDGWKQLHDRYGKLDWAYLFEPAITYAREGFPISQKFADYIADYADLMREYPEMGRTLMPGGENPRMGRVLQQPDLASSLKAVAEGGAEEFYRGDLAKRIVSSIQGAGGFLTERDFAEHRSDWVQPARTTYKGLEITELPPNTQGLSPLMILNLIEQWDLAAIGDNTADYYHLMAEATKVAFADSQAFITDPEFAEIPVDRLLSKEYAQERAELITMQKATNEADIPSMRERQMASSAMGGDTTYFCAVDGQGALCSQIQSVYHEFGSAFMAEGTGILMQNRGAFFKLDPEHPNTLEPGKRTFHTIIPALALKDGAPYMAFGTMGGEGQPQTQAAILTRVHDFGYTVQQAIEAPRWLYGRTWGEESKTMKVESRIPHDVQHELARRGHDMEPLEAYSQKMGHAQAIRLLDDGVLEAGADPRGDGAAMAW